MFINPEFHSDSNIIYSRTSFLEKILFLFCFDKTVEVNRIHKIIQIESRLFWFFKFQKSIPFTRIIDLETKAESKKNNMGMKSFKYNIVLVLKDPREKYTLISFKDGFTKADNAFHEYFDLLIKYIKDR